MLNHSLVTFITAGDPDAEKTLDFMKILEKYADAIELGIPFSDPMADGRAIQKANVRALSNGFRIGDVFDIVRKFRRESETPVILMTYLNPVFRMGFRTFAEKCQESGVDGVIVVDLPVDEEMAEVFVSICGDYGIKNIFLASPNTPDERLRRVDEMSTGFIYLTSDFGTTGVREEIPSKAFEFIKRAKRICRNPLGVGFGVSKAEHVRSLISAGADGVIVGSAIVELIEKFGRGASMHIERRLEELREGIANAYFG